MTNSMAESGQFPFAPSNQPMLVQLPHQLNKITQRRPRRQMLIIHTPRIRLDRDIARSGRQMHVTPRRRKNGKFGLELLHDGCRVLLHDYGDAELRKVAYWRPTILELAEIVFECFDGDFGEALHGFADEWVDAWMVEWVSARRWVLLVEEHSLELC